MFTLRPDEVPREYNQHQLWQILSRIASLVGQQSDGFLFEVAANEATTQDYEIPVGMDFCPVDATSAAATRVLPDPALCVGKRFTVKKIDASANSVTISVKTGETIDDATTQIITTQYDSVCLMSDGSEYWIV